MKTILDEELDPNTISSLLKQHIRDNGGLLPTKEAGDLYSAVRRKNVSYFCPIWLLNTSVYFSNDQFSSLEFVSV